MSSSRVFSKQCFRSPVFRSLAILLPLVAIGLGACSSSKSAEEEQPEAGPTPLVAVAEVEFQAWNETLDLTAELHPWAGVTVAAETAGRVVTLPVDHGDQIRKGELVARLEAAVATAELLQSKARLDSSRAELAQASRDLERGKSLADADQGIVSQDEVERLLVARDTRAAEVSESQAAVSVLQERLADMEVRAPFSGVVSERNVDEGSWVSAGSPVIRILDLSKLKVRASVASKDRMRLDLKHLASFRSDTAPEQTHAVELRFLGREADPATGTFLVEAFAPNEGETSNLLPGLQGTLTVILAAHEGLVIPKTALLSSGSAEYVFVIENDSAARRQVKTTPVDGRRVEVTSGLSVGDLLVVQGQHRLADGQAVEVYSP